MSSTALPSIGWRTPLVILVCGCVISLAGFGPRATLGLFTVPMTVERGFSLEAYSFAIAIQNLLWGLGAPFAGGLADRFGMPRVLAVGLLLYAGGLALMAVATDTLTLTLGAGVMIGFGLSGSGFGLVLSAFGKLLPENMRGMAFGVGSAAGSFGQFLFAPLSVALMRELGWPATLFVFAGLMLLTIPLAWALASPPRSAAAAAPVPEQTLKAALGEAFAHRSYVLLVAGFFVCGFHLAFITIHLPKYLMERGLTAEIGAWSLALIGLFNIIGSLGSGWLLARMPKRVLLSAIYALRAVAIVLFISLPMSTASALAFSAAMGVLWLSTVPPTNALVFVMFGTRWAAMLYGFAFFSHQLGSFFGLVIAAWTRTATGTYDVIWWLGILLGVFAALIHMPIRETPVQRLAPA